MCDRGGPVLEVRRQVGHELLQERQRALVSPSAPPCPPSRTVGTIDASVLGAVGSHLFPSRTQQLSPPAPKILGTSVPGKIGQGRDLKRLRRASVEVVLLFRRS